MAFRHLLLRFTPRLDGRWIIAAVVLVVLVVAGTFVRWSGPAAPLELMLLGPQGQFADSVRLPAEWADTATTTPDAIVRVPLMLGVRNLGRAPVRPERLALSLPVRYRLTAEGGQELESRVEAGSPLITYTVETGLGAVEPERLPAMLPAHDTLWLEVVVPSYYCVAVADSIPEFVPAPPAPVATMSEIRVFYAFEGGDLGERRTGTVAIGIDSALLRVEPPQRPPVYAMVNDPDLAQPDLGPLRRAGSRRSRCGEPESPMELLSTVWETESGGRLIALDYGGTVRKHLYDLDGDGVIERESWAPEGDDFTATRRTALPIPPFLLPETPPGGYDMARLDTLPADSLARLDPLRGAMTGPGTLPGTVGLSGADSARQALLRQAGSPTGAGPAGAAAGPAREADPELPADSLPEPRIERTGPLGVPVQRDTGSGGPGGRS